MIEGMASVGFASHAGPSIPMFFSSSDGDDAGDHREVVADAERRPEPRDPSAERVGDHEANDERQGNAHKDEVGGVAERLPELRIGEQPSVVVEPDERRADRVLDIA
jgi:hypothetical protein